MRIKRSWLVLLLIPAGFGLGASQDKQSPPIGPPAGSFSFVLRYGVGGRNVLDTANGRFTKDTTKGPVTTDLRLSDSELGQIQRKLVEIDFSNPEKYPRVFTVPNRRCTMDPHDSMVLTVTQNPTVKELTWSDMSSRQNCQWLFTESLKPEPDYLPAEHLRELVKLIEQIVKSKPEFQKLPASPMYW